MAMYDSFALVFENKVLNYPLIREIIAEIEDYTKRGEPIPQLTIRKLKNALNMY